MKALRYISILCMLLVVTSFNSCKDDDEKIVSGITGQSWQEGKPLAITAGEELSVSFNANDEWTATTNSDWCNILNKSGKAGQSTVRILVATTVGKPRTAFITIKVKGYDSESFQVTQDVNGGIASEDMEVNVKVDQYLRDMYLWNDEYKTLELDFTKNYERFLSDALKQMTTNKLDKREYTNEQGQPDVRLFSNIQKKNPISSTRATKFVDKELEYSYGITGITGVLFIGDIYNFCIQGVYPDSPAAAAGLKRGTLITKINGQELTPANANDFYRELLFPNSSSTLQITDSDNKQTSLTSKAMYLNPVIFKQVKEINGHRIGYLVYSDFNAAFDEELFDAFKYFKSQNVTDFILDLRYNLGGHTMSANLISSCIAGASASNKVFSSLRFNATRMKALNDKRYEEKFMYSNYENLGKSLVAGDLGLAHIYCLVGYNTASSSELVINSLKGIDVNVTLIGEQTVGKNIGMEPTEIIVGKNTYNFSPITFQSYNAKGFGDYEAGFTPDIKLDETNPYQEDGIFYRHRDYGSDGEFLYAAAIKDITGINILPPKTRSSINDSSTKGKVRKMQAPVKPGFGAMIRIPLE